MRTGMTSMRTNKLARGTTLIETLVALLVLSIGLLGVAGLQMSSLQNNRGAHMRSQAQVLAYDIADRMRANRNVALAGGYVIGFGGAAVGSTIEAIDLQNWKQSLGVALPGGDGQVELLATTMVRITVRWTDSLGAQQFTTQTRI
jgi:type IV pilus assembly protein PilV